MVQSQRIYLSPPHISKKELEYVQNAFASNWVAPVGPDLNAFEDCMCRYVRIPHAVALSSGTAAIHLALKVLGIGPGDDVYCSNFTFAGTIFPVEYCGANTVLVDSESKTWNMDPKLLVDAVEYSKKIGNTPKAVILVHLYGQSANVEAIQSICKKNGIVLIEDAAESLGACYKEKITGTIGDFGIYSFNGNKIITTSGGGMLVGSNKELIEKARFLSTQARDPFPYYQHSNIGYNYRMSNILAAIGRGQIEVIEQRINRKREIFKWYANAFADIEGIEMMPIDYFGRSNCWLSCIVIDKNNIVQSSQKIRDDLEKENIESRPLWKPMHLQPVFKKCPVFTNGVSDTLFEKGLCLPSGTAMSEKDLERIVRVVLRNISTR